MVATVVSPTVIPSGWFHSTLDLIGSKGGGGSAPGNNRLGTKAGAASGTTTDEELTT